MPSSHLILTLISTFPLLALIAFLLSICTHTQHTKHRWQTANCLVDSGIAIDVLEQDIDELFGLVEDLRTVVKSDESVSAGKRTCPGTCGRGEARGEASQTSKERAWRRVNLRDALSETRAQTSMNFPGDTQAEDNEVSSTVTNVSMRMPSLTDSTSELSGLTVVDDGEEDGSVVIGEIRNVYGDGRGVRKRVRGNDN